MTKIVIVQQYWPGTSFIFGKVIRINIDYYLSNILIYLLTSLISEVWCIGIDVELLIWRSLVRYLTNITLWFFKNLIARLIWNRFTTPGFRIPFKWCFYAQLCLLLLSVKFITVSFNGSFCDIMQSYMLKRIHAIKAFIKNST
jgi:hypothetical protein